MRIVNEVIEIRYLQMMYCSLVLSYWPGLFIVPLFTRKEQSLIPVPYILEVIFLLLCTMPFYIAFLSLGPSIMYKINKPICEKNEIIMNKISCVIACFIFLTAFNISNLLNIAFVLSTLLLIFQIIIKVAYKRKINILFFVKQKAFWLCTIFVLITIISVMTIWSNYSNAKNKHIDSTELNKTKIFFIQKTSE